MAPHSSYPVPCQGQVQSSGFPKPLFLPKGPDDANPPPVQGVTLFLIFSPDIYLGLLSHVSTADEEQHLAVSPTAQNERVPT
jgi:hypothetical protein